MPRSIEEIKADIAKVQSEIAQRKTYSQPQTRVGWATYMIDNDRGMLDKYADAERAYNNMLMQQEHAKAMQQEQIDNAKELAALQRQEQSVYNADEWQKNYELASAEYDAALADYTVDQNDPLKKARLRKAATNMNYWGAKRGYEAINPFDLVKEADDYAATQAQQEQIADSLTSRKNWDNATKKKAKEEAAKLTDPGKRAAALNEIAKRGKTKEELAKEKAARKSKFDSYKAMYTDSTGHVSPGKKAKLLKENAEFAKLYKEFGG